MSTTAYQPVGALLTPFAQEPLHRPLLLRALAGEVLERPPIWMMRQAGRYMPQYQAVRKRHTFLEICHTPEVAVEVTLQPLQAFGFDASIIFSDILIPLQAMGLELAFTDEKGPQFANPIRHVDDLKRLHTFDPYTACHFLVQSLEMMRQELTNTGITLIGFAGAPWTLASYALEGASWKTGRFSKQWLFEQPEVLHTLLQTITTMVIDYCDAQITSGAQVIQLFDTWAGNVPTPYFDSFVLAYQAQVINALKAKHPTVPVILFVKHSRGLLEKLATLQADAFSIDELTPLSAARQCFKPNTVLQGNLDSTALFLQNPQQLQALTQQVIQAGGASHYVFNLGHGVLPQTPVENVALVVETVKNWRW
jgi:uroporphyrinogen decarboxylase